MDPCREGSAGPVVTHPPSYPTTSVLVLDDRATDRELVATVLGYAGYIVLEAATGEAAIELARAERPDLIIADILMPDMDGYEFVRALRSDPAIASTRVLLCTATYDVEEVRRFAEACGVTQILAKPCPNEELVRVVGEVLESPRFLPAPLPAAEFEREHLRLLNGKLIEKVEALSAAERQTAEARTLLETLLTSAPVGFAFVDRDLRIRHINAALGSVSGIPIEEQIGRSVAEVVPDLWSQIEPSYRHVLETGEAILNVEVVRAEDPPGAWIESYYPVRIDEEIIGVGVLVIDITERHQAEEFRSVVVENMAEGLCVLDGEGCLTLMNAAATRMLGWREDELRGRPMHPIVHFQHADGTPRPEEDCDLLRVRTEARAIRNNDDAFTRKDGSIIPVAYSAAPLLSGTGVRGAVIVFRDITEEHAERTRVQRELGALTWVGRIREALDEGRLVLHAQPIVPLKGGEPSVELLLRMIGRNGEIVAPGSFLPVAEKYGLIGEIDRRSVAEAIRHAAGGRRVEVNVSAESVGPGSTLLSMIERELSGGGIDPAKLVFELTETALMKDIEAGKAFALGVTRLGCGVALDDFGTGFGSFNYLKNFPIGYLKIDVDFVRDLPSNPANQHVVKAIVSLARGFGQETIAEGVEDAETLELLRAYDVDFAQGFHLGRPAALAVAAPTAASAVDSYATASASASSA